MPEELIEEIAVEQPDGFTPELAEKFDSFMNIIVLALSVFFIVFVIKTVYKFLRMFF